MALRVGSLFVSLTANTDGFAKSMAGAMKDVERFSKEVKKAANDAAQIAGSITALGGAALKLASDVSGPTKAAMDELKLSMQQAAKPVAEALLPAVREASSTIRGLGKAFAELSPETKAMVGEVFKVAAAVTAAALVIGRLASLVQLAAGVMSGLAGAIAAIGTGPLLAVLAVVAALAAGVAVLHKAWRENWGGIQQVVGKVAQWFADTWDGALNFVRGAFSAFVDSLAGLAKVSLGILAKLADATGTGAGPAIRASMNVVDQIAKDMKSGASVKKFMVAALDLGKQGATAFMEEWKLVLAELGIDFAKFTAAVKKHFGDTALTVGPKVKYSDLGYGEYDASSPGIAGGEHMDPRGMVGLPPSKVRKGALGGTTAAVASKESIELANAAQAATEATKTGLMGVAQTMIGKLGKLGGIINDVISAAQTGGVWAAVGAAIGGVLTETAAFAELAQQASGALRDIVKAIEPAARGLFQTVGQALAGAVQVVAGAFQVIAPLFKFLGAILEPIGPVLMVVGQMLSAFAPLVELAVNLLMVPFKILGPILGGLHAALVAVGYGLTWFVKEIGGIWNSIVLALGTAISSIVEFISGGLIKNAGAFMGSLTVDLQPTIDAHNKLKQQGIDLLDALKNDPMSVISGDFAKTQVERIRVEQAAKDAIDDTTGSFEALNEAMLNVPTGFKVAAARFAADSGGYSGSSTGASGVTINGGIVIYANDSEEAMDQLEAMLSRRVFRSTGFATPASIGGLR